MEKDVVKLINKAKMMDLIDKLSEKFPPTSITFPNEYYGNQRLNVVCTQTDLPASRQTKLVKAGYMTNLNRLLIHQVG